jgi:hypothetical protein
VPDRTPDDPELAAQMRRVERRFQRYTSQQRADRAASHRLGHRQRQAVGEWFYVHPDVPDLAFDNRRSAAREAISRRRATRT